MFLEMFMKTIYKYVFSRKRTGDYVYLGSQISTPIVGFFTSIIAARSLLPYEMGVIQTVLLISVYCSFFHFGVFNGLNRNIAFYDAQNNKAKIQKMIEASWLTAVVNSILGILISSISLIYFLIFEYSYLHLFSVFALFGILTFLPLCTHYETVYRGHRAFMPLGIKLNIANGVNFVLGFLPIFFGSFGLIFRNATTPAVNFFLLNRNPPIKHRKMGSFDEVLDLARVGFPMLATGVLYVIFTAADRTVAAMTLGPTAVGELALSGLIVVAIQVLPISMGALLYPKASYIYGSTQTSLALRKFFFLV